MVSGLCVVQLLTQPGRTSLDADLQVLARHAAPADRTLYAKCLQIYRTVCHCTMQFLLCNLLPRMLVSTAPSIVLHQGLQREGCRHGPVHLIYPR